MVELEKICGAAIEDLRDLDLVSDIHLAHLSRKLLLDTFGCAIAGWRKPEPSKVLGCLGNTEPGEVKLPGAPPLSPTATAYILALGACWDEACEGLATAHGRPGLHTIPVAIALGMSHSLGDVLKSIVVGYDVGARAGIVSRIRPGLHVDGTWGRLGAAATAAYLIQKDLILPAIKAAACQLSQSLFVPVRDGATVRNLYSANAVADSVRLARVLDIGISVPTHVCLPDYLFYFDDRLSPPPQHRLIGDGYLKKFAGARHLHYGVEGALHWLSSGGDSLSIKRITLEIHEEAISYCSNRAPKTALQAQFSLTYALAHAIEKGHLDPEAYDETALSNENIQHLESLIKLVSLSGPSRRARLIIEGEQGRKEVEVDTISGDPEHPMQDSEIIDKFIKFAGPTLGDKEAESVAASILGAPMEHSLKEVLRI